MNLFNSSKKNIAAKINSLSQNASVKSSGSGSGVVRCSGTVFRAAVCIMSVCGCVCVPLTQLRLTDYKLAAER